MKTIFTIILSLALLLPLQLNAQTASKIPSLEVGGRTYTDLANLIILNCSELTALRVSECRADIDGDGVWTAYKPSGATKLKISMASCYSNGNQSIQFLIGTTNVGLDSASAPAGRINYGSHPDLFYNTVMTGAAAAAGTNPHNYAINWTIPNNYYPHIISSSANTHCLFYGYEE